MSNPIPDEPYEPADFGFYRPHPRVSEDGHLVDQVTGEVTYPPSMTKQAHREECDINNILKQYKLTGIVRHISARAAQGTYSDLPDEIDFQEALHAVKRSQDAFDSLPASIRARFGNDPGEFLEFVSDPRNADELIKLGLAQARPVEGDPSPAPAPATPAPGAAPAPSPAPANGT